MRRLVGKATSAASAAATEKFAPQQPGRQDGGHDFVGVLPAVLAHPRGADFAVVVVVVVAAAVVVVVAAASVGPP